VPVEICKAVPAIRTAAVIGQMVGPNVDRMPAAPSLPTNGGRDRFSARHIHDESDQPLRGK